MPTGAPITIAPNAFTKAPERINHKHFSKLKENESKYISNSKKCNLAL